MKRKLHVEPLEPRLALSLTFGFDDHHRPGHDGGPGGGDPPEPTESPIDLGTVVAHEIGHALGLKHSNNSDCGSAGQPIMCAYYLGSAFSLQQEDIDRINGLYPESGDPDTTNTQGSWNHTDLTYSFMPDGTDLEQQTVRGGGPPRLEADINTLFASLDASFVTADWQAIFSDALALWAADSILTFSEVTDDGAAFSMDGVQGDIRFGAHTFDGPSGALAHGYYAPPNGDTAAGDIHLDEAESWQDLRSSPISAPTSVLPLQSYAGLSYARSVDEIFACGSDTDDKKKPFLSMFPYLN